MIFIFKFIKKLINKKNTQENIKTSIVCPKCNGNIFEKDDFWVCENTLTNKCNIKISNIYKKQKLNFEYLIAFENSTQYNYCIMPAIVANIQKEWRIKKGLTNPIRLDDTYCSICGDYLYKDGDKILCTKCDFIT